MNAQRTLPVVRNLEMYLVAILLGSLAGWGYWWASQKTAALQTVTTVESIELSRAIAQLKSSLPPRLAAVLYQQPQTYWISISDQQEQLVPQPLSLDSQASPEESLRTAMETLLAGAVKIDSGFTAIPKETQLLSLTLNDQGIFVNLSREFASGGGSSSMIYRVAQVIYTVTSLDPEAEVYISVAGQPIDGDHPLGGEGLVLEQPVTRETFAKEFSF